ncbi:hypothetical protein ACMHYJ_06255 [Castellaniella hirudinis]|uniref:hypothetical protein n=1 Tax=Castellaniella hirudinis TaxID=1144617 RepID=UPI0039C23A61
MKSRTPNTQATDAYVELVISIQEKLAILQGAANDHFGADPDRIDWANVGDLTLTLNQLTDIADRITGQGEYAN